MDSHQVSLQSSSICRAPLRRLPLGFSVVGGAVGGRWALWEIIELEECSTWIQHSPSFAPVNVGQSEHPVAVDGKLVGCLPSGDEDRPSW